MDHRVHQRNIETARCDIGYDEHWDFVVAELCEIHGSRGHLRSHVGSNLTSIVP